MRHLLVATVTLVVCSIACSQLFNNQDVNASDKTVCPVGCDYSDLQAAVENAKPGDQLHIISGTYDRLILNKPLKFIGGKVGVITDSKSQTPSIKELFKCGYSLKMVGIWRSMGKTVDECIYPPCKTCSPTESSPPSDAKIYSEKPVTKTNANASNSNPQSAWSR